MGIKKDVRWLQTIVWERGRTTLRVWCMERKFMCWNVWVLPFEECFSCFVSVLLRNKRKKNNFSLIFSILTLLIALKNVSIPLWYMVHRIHTNTFENMKPTQGKKLTTIYLRYTYYI